MQLSLHNTLGATQAAAAGLLLGPFAYASTQNERWPILVLSLVSMLMVTITQCKTQRTHGAQFWGPGVAVTLLGAGLLLELDKLLLLSGAVFLSSSLLAAKPIPKPAALFATACACLMVPLPAPFETAVATQLASTEASLFVVIGQAAGLPVRLSGTQVFFEQTVVTINQDCSGTLLLIPALLGAMVAAALASSKRATLAVILLAVPIALLVNLIRLGVVLALISEGSFVEADAWHDMLGAAALTVSWALPIIVFTDLHHIKVDRGALKIFLLTAVVSASIGLAANLILMPMGGAISRQLELPAYVAGWVAEPMIIPTQELKILNADQVGRHRYTSGHGELIVTAIHHLDLAIGREHSSERCFKAMGWQVETINHQTFGSAGMLSRLIAKSGGHSQLVLELEIHNHPTKDGLVRIQLVADTALPIAEQQMFLNAFATKTLGELL